MSRLHDEHDPEIARTTERLLGSWQTDAAPSGAKRATMAALGVGLATTAATATAAGASALGGVARVGVISVVKAVAGGALAGVVVLGTTIYVQRAQAPAPIASADSMPAIVGQKPPPRAATSREPEENLEAQKADETRTDRALPIGPASETTAMRPRAEVPSMPAGQMPLPPEEATTRGMLPASSAGATTALAPATIPAPERGSALAREIALLDDSRAALARSEARTALRLLDRYTVEFAHGNLGPEAVVLRVDALLRIGDDAAARAVASQFALAHPNDSHLARIKSLFANAQKSTKTDLGGRP